MSATRKTVQVFISYSHRDRKHLEKLRIHLAGLARDARVHFWWDGELEVGKAWEPQILEAMRSADLVLLLLTANFVASDYAIEKELRLARERERRGEIDLVPIFVDSFDLGAHWLGQLQAITVNGKAIAQSRLGSSAWEHVARQIRLKVECIEGKRPAMQVLNEVEEVVYSGDVRLAELSTRPQVPIGQFPSVSAFWSNRSILVGGPEIVAVQGTFSQFAPMLMGPPGAKRVLHREFRQAIETHRRFGERKRLTINACMSISAGQMVHREMRRENKKRLVGLYESIVRNAIPIFVLPDYYDRELVPAFQETSGSESYEAIVTGRPFLLDNNYIRRFLSRQGIDKILPEFVIDNLCQDAYALEVGGPRTKVQKLANRPTRYLDGDIWLAVKSGEAERFVTGFVDITNEAERREEMKRMLEGARDSQILASSDGLHSLAQLLDPNSA
ncbi:MAG: toll/interleukin-1 receptor domain-containing protein [Blastocatellia bacterium]